jgi:hypothetical protein
VWIGGCLGCGGGCGSCWQWSPLYGRWIDVCYSHCPWRRAVDSRCSANDATGEVDSMTRRRICRVESFL